MVINVATDSNFLKLTLYSVTIAINHLKNINGCIKMQMAVPFSANTGPIFQRSLLRHLWIPSN